MLLGAGAAFVGSSYEMGTLTKMGPGFFPTVLGVILAFIGVLIAGSATLGDGAGQTDASSVPPDWRGWGCIIAGALLFGSGVLSRGAPAASGAPGVGGSAAGGGAAGGAASTAPSLPAADVTLTAQGIAFVQTTLEAPAGKAFTVAFDNLDVAPHNLEIKDASGASVFKGEIVNGPAVKVYSVSALPAGQYAFQCTVHPAMTGTLTVK